MSETPEFKSRRAKGEALVEEARQAREARNERVVLDDDGTEWCFGPVSPRHPATSIGE